MTLGGCIDGDEREELCILYLTAHKMLAMMQMQQTETVTIADTAIPALAPAEIAPLSYTELSVHFVCVCERERERERSKESC